MNKTISLIRVALLFALLTIGMMLLFGEEQDESLAVWVLHLLANKTICAGSLLSFGHLYKRWSKIDPWIIAYNKWCDKGLDEGE